VVPAAEALHRRARRGTDPHGGGADHGRADSGELTGAAGATSRHRRHVGDPNDCARSTNDRATPRGPVELARGEFVSLDHGTSGAARILELAAGQRIVRLEGLDTDNGPDLYLYLTTNPASGDEGAFDDEHVNLGRLKGNQGDQNYELPAGTDLARFGTVVIWCDRFNSAFGAADLDSSATS
jgi:hypothetical protein